MKFLRNTLEYSIAGLFIGAGGYFLSGDLWFKYVFVHIGALGLIGLFAYLIGIIAKKKNLDFKRAVITGIVLPVIFGIVFDYLLDAPQSNGLPSSCGGIVSLSVIFTIIIIYLLKRKKEQD